MTVSLSRLFRKICIKNNKKLTCHLFEMVASLKLFKIIKDNTIFTLQSILSEISQAEQPCASPCFVQARCFWEDFFKNHGNEPVAKLSQSLSLVQGKFLGLFPVYASPFAKGVMVATAISYIHDQANGNGFLKDPDDRYYEEDCVLLAKKVIEAFSNSNCSSEITTSAPEVGKQFGLE